jgi:hypothetical protein
MNTDAATAATIVRTAKGFTITFPDGRTANFSPNYTTAVVYSTGGWNPATQQSDLPSFSRHKSRAAAVKAGRDTAAAVGATFVLVDLATVGTDA